MKIKTFIFNYTSNNANHADDMDEAVNKFIAKVESNGGGIINVKQNFVEGESSFRYTYVVSYTEDRAV